MSWWKPIEFGGDVWQERLREINGDPSWHLRIPLANGDYVNFTRLNDPAGSRRAGYRRDSADHDSEVRAGPGRTQSRSISTPTDRCSIVTDTIGRTLFFSHNTIPPHPPAAPTQAIPARLRADRATLSPTAARR